METIDTLYSNIFFVNSLALLRFFPQLLPSGHLACMRGLIIHLNVELYNEAHAESSRDRSEGWTALTQILSVLGSGKLRSLRELDFSFVDPFPKEKQLAAHEKNKLHRILCKFDHLLLDLLGSTFQQFRLYMTLPLFYAAIDMTECHGNRMDNSQRICISKFWRPVRADSEVFRNKGDPGYWIWKGDVEPSWIYQSGF